MSATRAPSELRVAVLKLLQGEAKVAGEGDQVLDVAPAVLATANGSVDQLRPEYRRRAVVLDTGALAPLLVDLDLAAGALLAPGVLPRLDLNRLRPETSLPSEDRDLLGNLLRRLLTHEGWAASDRLGLDAAALGRAALYGLGAETAVMATALDYAACALTAGEVVP